MQYQLRQDSNTFLKSLVLLSRHFFCLLIPYASTHANATGKLFEHLIFICYSNEAKCKFRVSRYFNFHPSALSSKMLVWP